MSFNTRVQTAIALLALSVSASECSYTCNKWEVTAAGTDRGTKLTWCNNSCGSWGWPRLNSCDWVKQPVPAGAEVLCKCADLVAQGDGCSGSTTTTTTTTAESGSIGGQDGGPGDDSTTTTAGSGGTDGGSTSTSTTTTTTTTSTTSESRSTGGQGGGPGFPTTTTAGSGSTGGGSTTKFPSQRALAVQASCVTQCPKWSNETECPVKCGSYNFQNPTCAWDSGKSGNQACGCDSTLTETCTDPSKARGLRGPEA